MELRKDGIIQIPDKELEATGLHEGDEVCLLYMTKQKGESRNDSGEFMKPYMYIISQIRRRITQSYFTSKWY